MPQNSAPRRNGAAQALPADALPAVAYVLLWFPLSSETFVFHEVTHLQDLGMLVRCYTMYAKNLRGCSREMRAFDGPVLRMGARAFGRMLATFFRALRTRFALVRRLLGEIFFHRMRNLESLGENLWCFLAGFYLAERCRADGIRLIHAAWANGPATAAWVASQLTGIPFAFTGRAGDIYPEDGLLREKSRAALFIRANNRINEARLQSFCPVGQQGKVHLVYNSLTLDVDKPCAPAVHTPCRLLAVGRFVPKKGFSVLLTALARLRRENVPVTLTLVGSGVLRRALERQCQRLHLANVVDMPGFMPHDAIRDLMHSHDMLIVPSVVHENGDRDGIPNVIMEALSSNLPVIATDVCAIGEVIRHGETGLLVPQRDPRALGDAVRQLMDDWGAARRMAVAGRALVAEMFDGQRNMTALRDLYTRECAVWWSQPGAHASTTGGKEA